MSDRTEMPTMAETVYRLAERLVKAEAKIDALKERLAQPGVVYSGWAFGAPLLSRRDVRNAVRNAIARATSGGAA